MQEETKTGPTGATGIMGVPSLLVAICWVGLWSVWPWQVEHVPRVRRVTGTRIVCTGAPVGADTMHMLPDIWVHSSRNIYRLRQQEDGIDTELPVVPVRAPRFLDRQDVAGSVYARHDESSLRRRAYDALGCYRPRPWRERVFAPVSAGEMKIVIKPCRALGRQGFVAPSFSEAGMPVPDKAWRMILYLEMDQDGKPEFVLVEKGTDHADVNATVVRTMYGAKVTGSGTRCGGRVIVNYGSP